MPARRGERAPSSSASADGFLKTTSRDAGYRKAARFLMLQEGGVLEFDPSAGQPRL